MDVQTDLSLCWVHLPLCWYCHDVAHIYVLYKQVVRLSMVKDGAVAVTQMGEGNYESRQRRVSYWNNMKIVIYNDRNGLYSKQRIK